MVEHLVAIVGRPNVGKSTLFNRIVGERSAIVHDLPGVTRDRHYARAEWAGKQFSLVDTGGFVPASEDVMETAIREQAQIAIEEADIILFLVDAKDGLLIFSVGGGNLEKNVSPNLVSAIQLAKKVGASVIGIVGRDGGYSAKEATACVIVPTVNPTHVTPHSETFQAVVWHLLVSHPKLKVGQTKWESTK